MLVTLALRSVVAAALAVAPAANNPASPPVQTPTRTQVPVQTPTSPASASGDRAYVGTDALVGSAPAPVPAPVAESEPVFAPAPIVPPPVIAPGQDTLEEEGPEDGPAYDPLVDSPEAIRARHWVGGGIAFTVVGGVLTIGGIAMRTAPINDPFTGSMECNVKGDPAGNGCTEGGRNRAAAALAIPGALLLAGGIAMLVVGKLQQRRLRASLQADRRGFMLGATVHF